MGGGGATFAEQLARSFAAGGHGVRVLTSLHADLPAEERRDGYAIHRVSMGRRRRDSSTPFQMARFVVAATRAGRRLVTRDRPDAALACFALPAGWVAEGLKRATGLPYVISLLGHDVPGFMDELYGRYHRCLRPVTRRVWRCAAAVTANSPGLARLAAATATPLGLEVHVILQGVDSSFYTPAAARPEGPLRLVFVGRLNPQKGLTFLLAALRALAASSPRTAPPVLDVVGDGSGRGQLEAEAGGLGLGGRVRFHGWLGRDALRLTLQAADLFVLPSLEEGMSIALLEAMACGLPIVATRVAGSTELVADGENGLLVDPRDAEGLARAVGRLLADPELRGRMGRASRARSLDWEWGATAERYVALLERAAAGSPGRDRSPLSAG